MSKFKKEVEKFEKLFGYGSFRPLKNKVEVRVKDLDQGLDNARKIIINNNLNLRIGATTPQLRSFDLEEKLCQ